MRVLFLDRKSIILFYSFLIILLITSNNLTAVNAKSNSDGEWTTIASMKDKRGYGPGAVLLDNGKVLVAGGRSGSNTNSILSSVEIYDPKTNKWTKASDMNYHRRTFSMVKLDDGRVMAIGGYGRKVGKSSGNETLKTAEIYDPETDKWTLVKSMNEERFSPSAVTLNDGRVLITGGGSRNSVSSAKNTTEIYDPKTNTWTKSTPMLEERSSHASVLTSDGKVLVTGGGNSNISHLDTSEVYDPKNKKWSAVAKMPQPRRTHKMVRLADGRILSVGGVNEDGYMRTTDLYSVNDNSWTNGANMNKERRNPAITIMADDRVLVAGGRSDKNVYLNSAEIGFFNRAPIVELKAPKNKTSFEATEKETSLQWSATDPDGDKIKKYRLKIGTKSGDSDILNIEGNWQDSYQLDLTKLPTDTTFYWSVQAKDEHNEWSDWSSERTFSIEKEVFDLDISTIQSFSDITLQEEPQVYKTSFDGTFQVANTKRSNNGWKVQVRASQFQQTKTGDTLPKGSLYLDPIDSVKHISGGNGTPKIPNSTSVIIDGDGYVSVLEASKENRYGKFEFSFPKNSLSIIIDPTTAKTGTYESTLTWDLVQAP